ncbi:MAG: N-acetylmuramoyl-L-alanine amidase [Actinobacteria bacterium]|nr:N-acetylmuramoyl-L-alanine amidase [Actinomycetota bacterium]MBI3688059.1 N-acetylmuramoyl-L-alanine amidase [Actinomycetota bacterium]
MTLPLIEAAAHGGPFAVPPNLIVIHSMEAPIKAGLARSLAGPNFFGKPPSAGGPGTSVHRLWDPAEGIQGVPNDHIAYHCGAPGNARSEGDEHCGYTAYSRAQWITPDGLAMLRRSATHIASRCAERGIPVRWLSLAQVAKAADTRRPQDGGLCTHNDIAQALGGTTHTDPGAGFPYDLYLGYARDATGGDVPLTDTDKAWITGALNQATNRAVSARYDTGAATIREFLKSWPAARAALNPQALASAVATALPAGSSQLTAADIEAALLAVLGDAPEAGTDGSG